MNDIKSKSPEKPLIKLKEWRNLFILLREYFGKNLWKLHSVKSEFHQWKNYILWELH